MTKKLFVIATQNAWPSDSYTTIASFIDEHEACMFQDGYNAAASRSPGLNPAVLRVEQALVCPACGEFRSLSKIDVIKHVRNEHNISGLKNAKEFVEEWQKRDS